MKGRIETKQQKRTEQRKRVAKDHRSENQTEFIEILFVLIPIPKLYDILLEVLE